MITDQMAEYRRLNGEAEALARGAVREENVKEQRVLFQLSAELQRRATAALRASLKYEKDRLDEIRDRIHAENADIVPDGHKV